MTGELPFDIERLIELRRQSGVVQIAIFGSMARGEANQQSDIDLVVKFSNVSSDLSAPSANRHLGRSRQSTKVRRYLHRL